MMCTMITIMSLMRMLKSSKVMMNNIIRISLLATKSYFGNSNKIRVIDTMKEHMMLTTKITITSIVCITSKFLVLKAMESTRRLLAKLDRLVPVVNKVLLSFRNSQNKEVKQQVDLREKWLRNLRLLLVRNANCGEINCS